MNIREGTLAYYDILADKPQTLCRLQQGRFDVEPMIDHLIKEGVFAMQGTIFYDGGIVFRADKPGDPILKYEKTQAEKLAEVRAELKRIADSAKYSGDGSCL